MVSSRNIDCYLYTISLVLTHRAKLYLYWFYSLIVLQLYLVERLRR